MLHEDMLIDGKRTPARSSKTTQLLNPATGRLLAEVAQGDTVDVNTAVEVAHEAFTSGLWRKMNSSERTKVLLRLSGLIREHQEALARLESQNVGKPIREARDEVGLAADCFEYYAGAINKVTGQTIPVAAPGVSMTFREPLGVCGLILPWNFPLAIASWKIAPALAMANTLVVKPASQTPLTALHLAELGLEAGIPEGVLNVVCGRGEAVGDAITRHPLVRKLSFTGSTEIGSRVMRLAADDIKRVTLELGGKSANIIFEDADLAEAVPAAVWSALGNAGQDCCARSRLLIARPIFDEFVSGLERHLTHLRLGNPLADETEIGSLISSEHRDRVLEFVNSGTSEGADLVCGGAVPNGSELEAGAFLTPGLFASVKPHMRIMREEIFGPILCAMPFDDEREAVRIANDSPYGLSGSVWTRDIERALRVASAVETGVISVNTGHSVHLEAPFGGVKRSGVGRELGLSALEHYSELKSVFVRVGNA